MLTDFVSQSNTATFKFAPPAVGNYQAITGYEAVVSPGGITKTVSAVATTVTFTGLSNSTTYSVTLRSLSATGSGPYSDQDNSVTPHSPAPTCFDATETEIYDRLNDYRGSFGMPSLTGDCSLGAAAKLHNQNMIASGVFAHQIPGELPLCALGDNNDRYDLQGYQWSACGEVLASGHPTAKEVMSFESGWAGSPGHRSTMLCPGYAHVGPSMVSQGAIKWWTTDFGRPMPIPTPSNVVPGPVGSVDVQASGPGKFDISFPTLGTTCAGGAAIVGYRITASPGGRTLTVAGGTATFGGFTPGVDYTFVVEAISSIGSGIPSLPSYPTSS